MKYLDEYRDARIARNLAAEITRRAKHHWVLMEICGGQTHTLLRYGIAELLPREVELVHGPGCPVCVTPLEVLDKAVALAGQPGVTLVSYGDMLRVPGSNSDLFHAKAHGGDVRVVYSPMDALALARREPRRRVVFFAIGFETTAPAHAAVVKQARREGVKNFSLLVSHVLVPPAMAALLASPRNRVQGLIAPGHVCTVTGVEDYRVVAERFRIPIVVGGFEPVDLLEAILKLVTQLEEGRAEVEIQYGRSVTPQGNLPAQRLVREVFEVCDRKWRGIGMIPQSGLRLRADYAEYDAERIFGMTESGAAERPECIAAEILQGWKKPTDCAEFGRGCSPERPLGAPMVSAEGACSAYFRYRHAGQATAPEENQIRESAGG
jgi:hydrogenase expression/formation protein HypD